MLPIVPTIKKEFAPKLAGLKSTFSEIFGRHTLFNIAFYSILANYSSFFLLSTDLASLMQPFQHA